MPTRFNKDNPHRLQRQIENGNVPAVKRGGEDAHRAMINWAALKLRTSPDTLKQVFTALGIDFAKKLYNQHYVDGLQEYMQYLVRDINVHTASHYIVRRDSYAGRILKFFRLVSDSNFNANEYYMEFEKCRDKEKTTKQFISLPKTEK